MRAFKAIILFIMLPNMDTYRVDPFLFWIQCLIAGFVYSLLLLAGIGIWYYYFSGDLDYWKDVEDNK